MLLGMRTTLDIEDDVLQSARELAARRGQSLGAVVSELLRGALGSPSASSVVRDGVPLLPCRPRGAPRPDQDAVNRLRDE